MKSVTVQELREWQAAGEDIQIIDVREPAELAEGEMGGTLIPLNTIGYDFDLVSRDKKVIVHCRSGKRSQVAIHMLETDHGFDNLYNLEGGIMAWVNSVA
jgi:adenylyltransferase/sulfurtransferase